MDQNPQRPTVSLVLKILRGFSVDLPSSAQRLAQWCGARCVLSPHSYHGIAEPEAGTFARRCPDPCSVAVRHRGRSNFVLYSKPTLVSACSESTACRSRVSAPAALRERRNLVRFSVHLNSMVNNIMCSVWSLKILERVFRQIFSNTCDQVDFCGFIPVKFTF